MQSILRWPRRQLSAGYTAGRHLPWLQPWADSLSLGENMAISSSDFDLSFLSSFTFFLPAGPCGPTTWPYWLLESETQPVWVLNGRLGHQLRRIRQRCSSWASQGCPSLCLWLLSHGLVSVSWDGRGPWKGIGEHLTCFKDQEIPVTRLYTERLPWIIDITLQELEIRAVATSWRTLKRSQGLKMGHEGYGEEFPLVCEWKKKGLSKSKKKKNVIA